MNVQTTQSITSANYAQHHVQHHIAQEIEEVETPRRRFMKTTSVKHKNIVTPVQRGPIDSFFNRVKRKLSPEKDQDAGGSEQKQVRSETRKI